jgi:hypothetical protein
MHLQLFYHYVLFSISFLAHISELLSLSNPIFLPPAYSPPLIYFGRERGWWVTCNYPTVLKEKTETERVLPALSVG